MGGAINVLLTLLGIHFSDTVTLGTSILAAIVLGSIAYFRIRSGVGEVWENVAKGYEERAALAEQQLKESAKVIADQRVAIEKFEALPNLERIVNLMAETAERADQRAEKRLEAGLHRVEGFFDAKITAHETHAQQRHDEQIALMQAMQETQKEMHEVFRHIGNGP